ncbi:MAG: hypothetical protein HC925_08540 [Coleofasciculaceae cyanobacterium SM2_3_26]|nr:hypothetical protein [Coleofasciculaceae cyanobacterium SM2_3_26]
MRRLPFCDRCPQTTVSTPWDSSPSTSAFILLPTSNSAPPFPVPMTATMPIFPSLVSRRSQWRPCLAFTRSQWIPVVFISLPLTQEYLDPTRQAYENRFRQYIQGFADGGRLTFRDFSTKWLNQHAYFQDPSHLNRYGAAALAIALAKDPGIPWSLLRR